MRVNLSRVSFAASMLLIVIVVGALVRSSSRETTTEVEHSTLPPPQPAAITPVSRSIADDYQTMLARGVSEDEAKTLLLVRLETTARAAVAEPVRAYWRPHAAADTDVRLRLLDEIGRARKILSGIFGDEVDADPIFARLFRPLDPEFAFLTTSQQIDIQRLKLLQQQASIEAVETAQSIGNCQLQPQTATSVGDLKGQVDFSAELAKVLKEPALSEYLLRDSPLSAQLRASRVDFNETEFREAFGILRRLDATPADRDLYASSREALRRLLGGRRFSELWSRRDPFFAVIRSAAARLSLGEDTLASVYEIFNDHQDNVMRAMKLGTGDPERLHQELSVAQAGMKEKLSGLVGEEAAADILRRYTQQMANLTRATR